MSYNFKKLSEVEALAEVPEGANALIEIDGEIKRVSGSSLGGSGIKTAIIKDSEYDNTIAGISTLMSAPEKTYECINMTFEEAYETMANSEPLSVFIMFSSSEGGVNEYGFAAFAGTCIMVLFNDTNTILFWTADGLSTEPPSSGGAS